VFSGILQGLQEFYWINLTQVTANLLRALLIVIALKNGGGLLTVASITLVVPLLASGVCIPLVWRLIRVPFQAQYIDKAAFRKLINYGAVTFMIIVAERLRFQTDAMVIGVFISASAITYFSIGSKLVDYASNIVDSMADTFMPVSSHFDATDDATRMRRLFITGNRTCAMVILPVCATLLILGKSIIEVWVGPKYISSYIILVLLVVPRTLYRSQGASTRILFGMARHRPLALFVLGEGVANLVLSIVLVRRFGIVGVAIGTAVPLLFTSLGFMPYFLCHLLKVRLREFLTCAYLPAFGLCIPLVVTLLWVRHLFYAHNYVQLLVQLLAGGVVYCAGALWFFFTREPMGMELRTRFTEYMQQAAGR
jgi:O-antigen/teichoic acid export membrane protein